MVCQIVEDINADRKDWNQLGFVDDARELTGKDKHGFPVLGDSTWLSSTPGSRS